MGHTMERDGWRLDQSAAITIEHRSGIVDFVSIVNGIGGLRYGYLAKPAEPYW